jgi:hypothetical protein
MKKILFASTALVAASMMSAGTAEAADKIKLNLGGFSKWWVVGNWQSTSYQNAMSSTANVGGIGGTANNNLGVNAAASLGSAKQYANFDTRGDNEIWFSGDTKLDNGLSVGVFVSLEAGGQTDILTDSIDKSYAWVSGGFGKIIAGTLANGTALLHVSAPDAIGSIGGSTPFGQNYVVAKPASVIGMNQIVGYSSATNLTAIVADDNAEKVTYVAPSFYGLTAGASYIPNVARQDNRALTMGRSEAWGAGALYANTFGPVGVKVSAGYVWVDLTSSGAVGEKAYTAQAYGAQLSYAGFTLGGSFQRSSDDHGNGALTNSVLGTGAAGANGSQTYGSAGTAASYVQPGGSTAAPKTLNGNSSVGNDFGGIAYDIGLSYASGPYAVSFGYFRSEVNGAMNLIGVSDRKDTIQLYQASGKYALGPGVDLLAVVGYAEYKDQRAGLSTTKELNDAWQNSGWALMTGVGLTF